MSPSTVARRAVQDHGAMQKPRELAALLLLLRDHFRHPHPLGNVLEIGGMHGGTTFAFAQYATGQIVVADKFVLDGRMERAEVPYILVQGDSHDPGTRERVEPWAPYDFLFIDGDHSYEGVRSDFLMYAPLVRPGGIIALHDVSVEQQAKYLPQHNVVPWWNQVRPFYTHREIYDPNGGVWGGIGVLFQPRFPSQIEELLAALGALPMPTPEQCVATVPVDDPCLRCGKKLVWGEDTVCRECAAGR